MERKDFTGIMKTLDFSVKTAKTSEGIISTYVHENGLVLRFDDWDCINIESSQWAAVHVKDVAALLIGAFKLGLSKDEVVDMWERLIGV